MERDSGRKQTLCSLNLCICKQRPQGTASQKQGCICIVNKESSLTESDGDNLAARTAFQSSANDVAMNIDENREELSRPPTSTIQELQVLGGATKQLDSSSSKEALQVGETATQETQMHKFVTLGRPYGEKAALEATSVRQSKIKATQSGILDFLTVEARKQGSKQEKLLKGISNGTGMQMNLEAELHRNSGIQKSFDEKEGNFFVSTPLKEKENNSLTSTILSTTHVECEEYALEKEEDQNLSSLKSAGFSCDKKLEVIQNDFFLPSSKKRKWQGAVNVSLTDSTRASKKDSLGLKQSTPNDVEIPEGSKSLKLKQPPCRHQVNGVDFFIPASKKLKQTMHVTTTSESITQAEIRGKKCFEFDLQMEAKLAAEENAQLCAGKPAHPFFSSRVGPRACTDSNAFSTPAVSRLEGLTPAQPLHINQLDKECDTGHKVLSFDRGFCSREMDESQINASMEMLGSLLKRPFLSQLYKAKRFKPFCANHAKKSSGGRLDLMSSRTTLGRNLLWVDAYQPNSPEQVCGNKDSVKYLSDWLQNWQSRCTSLAGCSESDILQRSVANGQKCDEDKVWSEEDSDNDDNTSNGYAPPNVLFLVGPIGCGKTAAMYVCAKTHGYTVIEVNCTENRSGILIKQKFSEAMESHCVGKWSADGTVFSTTKGHHSAESNACRGDTFALKAKKAEQVDGKRNSSNVEALINHNDIRNSKLPSRLTDLESNAQQLRENDESSDNKEKTILLFEDVDVIFEDDRGFMAAVTQVAESAKRPIILTGNDKGVCLPHNLRSHMLEFDRPSTEDVISLAHQVCVAEGIICSRELLQKVVTGCNHDARKVLNYLQFWCQGKCYVSPQKAELENEIAKVGIDERDSEISSSVGLEDSDHEAITYLFDLEAQHRLWPAYVNFDFPCNVTKLVSCKLSERVSEVETQHQADREKKLVQELIRKKVLLDKMRRRMTDSSSILGLNYPYESEGEDIAVDSLSDKELDFLVLPVEDIEEAQIVDQSPALKRKSRRQLTIVMSESDDDTPVVSYKEEHHRDEQPSHVEPEPSSFLTSPQTFGEMGSTKGKDSPALSDLHADTNGDAVQTEDTSYGKEPPSSTPKYPHVELGTNQVNKDLHSSLSKCPREELGVHEAAACSFAITSESVYSLWANFRICSDNKDEFLMSPKSKESFSVVSSLSDLSDNLSACDIMSYRQDVKNGPEYCEWVPICAQIAHTSFQLCLEVVKKVEEFKHEDRDKFSAEDMMLAVNDPFTLGTKLVTDEKHNNQEGMSYRQADLSSEEQNQIRLQKKASLQSEVFAELPLPAQRSLQGAAFYENLSFLARMGHLEQARCTLGSTRLRARVSQSLFCSHPWDLSGNSISILVSFGTFGNKKGIARC